MIAKKTNSRMKSATLLSPRELVEAKRLLKDLRSAEEIEDLMYYQEKLEKLIEKANSNKETVDRHVRQTVTGMKKMGKDEVLAKYSRRAKDSAVEAKTVEDSDGKILAVEIPISSVKVDEKRMPGLTIKGSGIKSGSYRRKM